MFVLLYILVAVATSFAFGFENQLIGNAQFVLKSVEQCPDYEQYPYHIHVLRQKIDRHHDRFTGNWTMDKDLDGNIGLYMNSAQFMDGGWKPNMFEVNNDNACEFFMENGNRTFTRLLRELLLPEKCPLVKGFHEVRDFQVDYSDVPKYMKYGQYRVTAFLVEATKKIMCLLVYIDIIPEKN